MNFRYCKHARYIKRPADKIAISKFARWLTLIFDLLGQRLRVKLFPTMFGYYEPHYANMHEGGTIGLVYALWAGNT